MIFPHWMDDELYSERWLSQHERSERISELLAEDLHEGTLRQQPHALHPLVRLARGEINWNQYVKLKEEANDNG